MPNYSFSDLPVLVDRLSFSAKQGKRVVFLLGAPLASPETSGAPGVPGVSSMIDLIRSEVVHSTNGASEWAVKVERSDSKYQSAFELLIASRGQDEANRIIRNAVLMARFTKVPEACDTGSLEDDLENWAIPAGLRALGRMVVEFPLVFGHTVLTTNFDPLIEVSINRNQGRCFRTVLHRDGDLTQTTAPGCHVVHFHGYWIGHDTLHTSLQLTQPRPRLKHSLASLLKNSTVVVLGYGGWDDVFTRSLVDVVLDDSARPDILWCFYDHDVSSITFNSARVLNDLEPGLARGRVVLYRSIDCNMFLPRLHSELASSASTRAALVGAVPSGGSISISQPSAVDPNVEILIKIPSKQSIASGSDSPPQVDEWVGREAELSLLRNAGTPVAIITGIGGQGKSALASQFMKSEAQSEAFEAWDWRDCDVPPPSVAS